MDFQYKDEKVYNIKRVFNNITHLGKVKIKRCILLKCNLKEYVITRESHYTIHRRIIYKFGCRQFDT